MKTKNIFKSTLSLVFVILLALFISACGSSNKATEGKITYDGNSEPAVITADNAVELSSKAIGIGFATDIESAYSSSVAKTSEVLTGAEKSIADEITKEAIDTAFETFINDIIYIDNKALASIDYLACYGGLISYGGSAYHLYEGEYTNKVVYDDATTTFTITDTFTNAKIVNGENEIPPGSESPQANRELVDANGIITQTFSFDLAEAEESHIETELSVPEPDMAALFSYIYATHISPASATTLMGQTKACSGLNVTYTNLDNPLDNDDFNDDLYDTDFGGYGGYDNVTKAQYILEGVFDYAMTDTKSTPEEGHEDDEIRNDTEVSTFSGTITILTDETDVTSNYASTFEVTASGESSFSYSNHETDINDSEVAPTAKGTYATETKSTKKINSVSINGTIDAKSTASDSLTSETFTLSMTEGLYEINSDTETSELNNPDLTDLEDGEKYVDFSKNLKHTNSTTISGKATAKLEIKVHALAAVTQSVDFALESGSATFTGAEEEKTIVVYKYETGKAVGEYMILDSSKDYSNSSTAVISGSASISHADKLIALSGEYKSETIETIHNDNPEQGGTDDDTERSHFTDVNTVTTMTTLDTLNLKTDFFDVTLQGTISENTDKLTESYESKSCAINVDMVVQDNVNAKDYWFKDYVINLTTGSEEIRSIKRPQSPTYKTLTATITGQFFSSSAGYVDVTTMTPFLITDEEMQFSDSNINTLFPKTGELLISGANDTKAGFFVFTENGSAAGYTIEADFDGDDQADFTITKAWPNVEDFINNFWLFKFMSIDDDEGDR